ncbi:MAG: Holliday junction resolvase RuvX [Alphaproteobacteria bacterium]|nr:Holliday junction resolvase RuvX [Alphaproteobacteria bacterium]
MTVIDIAALGPALPPHGRLLGLDVGSRTIGLATSDVLRSLATPLETIERSKFTKDAARLADIIRRQEIVALAVGLPLNMDGSEGPRCQSVRQFVANLMALDLDLGPQPGARGGAARQFVDLPVVLQDERLSTAGVERTMIETYDMSRSKRAARIDAGAAAWILQAVLDRLRHAAT